MRPPAFRKTALASSPLQRRPKKGVHSLGGEGSGANTDVGCAIKGGRSRRSDAPL